MKNRAKEGIIALISKERGSDMAELKEIVAKNIMELRTASKLTQLELGNAISYSDKAISKWERGESIPDAYVLLKLAEIFGVTVDYILHEHEGGAQIKVKKKVNHASIVALSVIAIWMVFGIAYLCVSLGGYNYPMLFMYATVVTLIVLTMFNSIWGKRSRNILIVSALVVSLIVMIYLIFLTAHHNFWQINMLCIPAVGIVICCFKIKDKSLFKTKSKKE